MDPNSPFSGLSPEALQQILNLGTLNQQDDLLQQQLAQAYALRSQHPAQGYGALGGLGAGLTNAFNGIDAAMEKRNALHGLAQNQGAEGAGRTAYAHAVFGDPMAAQAAQAQALKRPPAMLDADPSRALAGYGFGDY